MLCPEHKTFLRPFTNQCHGLKAVILEKRLGIPAVTDLLKDFLDLHLNIACE